MRSKVTRRVPFSAQIKTICTHKSAVQLPQGPQQGAMSPCITLPTLCPGKRQRRGFGGCLPVSRCFRRPQSASRLTSPASDSTSSLTEITVPGQNPVESRSVLCCLPGTLRSRHSVVSLQRLLANVGDWDFNVFNLDKLTGGRSLYHLTLHLFQEHGLIRIFNLDIVKLMKCITLIEEGYHSNNPYHNSVHAADVTQAMHCYLMESKLAQCMSPLEKMVAIIAAVTHDVDHPGVNQNFLIATNNHLATLYKNQSVLENHHWRTAVAILHESGLFDHLDVNTRNTIELHIRSLILATDISRQQEFVNELKNYMQTGKLNLHNEEHRHFILQIALKCADICNPCRSTPISKKWSYRVCDEFYRQGDYERNLNIPVTPSLDRYITPVPKIQSGFMQFVAVPLFERWCEFNDTQLSRTMLNNAIINQKMWMTMLEEEKSAQEGTSTSSCGQTARHQQTPVTTQPTPSSVTSQVQTHVQVSAPQSAPAIVSDHHTSDENGGSTGDGVSVAAVAAVTVNIDSADSTPSRDDGDQINDIRYPLIPVTEGVVMANWTGRRHSLPPPSLAKDLAQLLGVAKENISCTNKSNGSNKNGANKYNNGPATFKGRHEKRRHSLPHTMLGHLISNSSCVGGKQSDTDRKLKALSETDRKLLALSELPPTNGNRAKTAAVLESLLKRRAVSLTPAMEAELLERHLRRRGSGPAQLYSHQSEWASPIMSTNATPPYRTIRSASTPGRGVSIEPTLPSSRTFHNHSTDPRPALQPLSTNVVRRATPTTCQTNKSPALLQSGSSRARSGSEDVSSTYGHCLHAGGADRPRSVSFDADAQTQQRADPRYTHKNKDRHTYSGHSGTPHDDMSDDDTQLLLDALSADTIAKEASSVTMEEESLTTPLLYTEHTSSLVPDVVQSSEV